MAYLTGHLLIDAPAAALNNLGKIEGATTDNAVGVKCIKTKNGLYPYVSAQAFRYWLRNTLENEGSGWRAAPIYREQKVAYTDANPIRYWDDDLFGYMRAPSKKTSAVEARGKDQSRLAETPTTDTVTRVSPFRVGTLVSLGPVSLVDDFGVMARQEGDPVPYEHQFYRTTLGGLISLDLQATGTFTFEKRTGYLNLDETRIEEAKREGLTELKAVKAYRLPTQQRLERITVLLKAISALEGGAKQALHYTDVNPDLLTMAITKGGNNLFGHIWGVDGKGQPTLKIEALKEALEVFTAELLSPVYIGWVQGYLDEERARLNKALEDQTLLAPWADKIVIQHPRTMIDRVTSDLQQHPEWLE